MKKRKKKMPEILEIRSLSGTITLGEGKDAHVLIPRFEYRGCTPPVGPKPLNFLTPYNQEIKQFLEWLSKFTPKIFPGSIKQCIAAFEPFLHKSTSAFHLPASFGSLSLKDDFSCIFQRDDVVQIGRRVTARQVIGKYFSSEEELKDQLRPVNGGVTPEMAQIIHESPYNLRSGFSWDDYNNLKDSISQFFYFHKNEPSLANNFMKKVTVALGNNGDQMIWSPEELESEIPLSRYVMWNIIELASAIIILLVFGELEMAEKVKAIIQAYESSVWPLCLLEHKNAENEPVHSTTILLLCS